MATALTAALAGVLFIAWPDSESFYIPFFVLGKLYANSLLRVLNSRNRAKFTEDVITLSFPFEGSSASLEQPCQVQNEEGCNRSGL